MTTRKSKTKSKTKTKPKSKPSSGGKRTSPARNKSEKAKMATNSGKISGDPAAAAKAAEALAASSQGDVPGVEKIRELLFGNQMQDYDRRFDKLEDRLQQKMREAEDEAARSLKSTESSLKKQLDSMAKQFQKDKDVLAEADKSLDRSLRESLQALEKRVSQAADEIGRLEREYTERLEEASQDLREESRKRSEELHATIERMFSELSSVKTDRNLLAGLFVEIARCLNQDTSSKGSGKDTVKSVGGSGR
jgi:chromosome segregation ATPase